MFLSQLFLFFFLNSGCLKKAKSIAYYEEKQRPDRSKEKKKTFEEFYGWRYHHPWELNNKITNCFSRCRFIICIKNLCAWKITFINVTYFIYKYLSISLQSQAEHGEFSELSFLPNGKYCIILKFLGYAE